MSDSNPTSSVLHRKAAVGMQQHQARSVTIAKGLRLSIAKVARDNFDMPLQAIGLVVEDQPQEACVEILDEACLLVLLEGTGGRIGMAVIDPVLVDGLIQQQTMGQVLPPLGDPRGMTPTDAAMFATLLEALLSRSAGAVELEADKSLLLGYSFGSHVSEARLAAMALENSAYKVIRLTVDMAMGARQGDLSLILPLTPEDGPGGGKESDETDDANSDAANAQPETMTDVVMHLEAELMIELCHVRMTLDGLQKIAAGDALLLPPGTFPGVKVMSASGKCLAKGTLGQAGGMRALKLDREPAHAERPMRRASDAPDVEVPQITGYAVGGGAQDMPEALTIPQMADDIDLTAEIPDFSQSGDADLPDLPEMGDLPDLDALPELDDFPDLADLPDLGDLPDLKTG